MNDFMRSSKFVPIFTGDGRWAIVVDGWMSLIREFRKGLWDGPIEEPNQPEWEEAFAAISDPSNWDHDDAGPWSYQESYEDGGVAVYRLAD
jgi:hypothetical protein